MYIYNSRRPYSLTLNYFIKEITKVKNIEDRISKNKKKHNIYKEIWEQVENILKAKAI